MNFVLTKINYVEGAVVPEDARMILRDGIRLSHAPVLEALQAFLATHLHFEFMHVKDRAELIDQAGVGWSLGVLELGVELVNLVKGILLLRLVLKLLCH